MKKYIKLLLLLIYTTSLQSQPLDSLMEIAIKSHPSLKVADLKIQQQELLRNSGFELQPTDFYYLGQALGYANDNQQHDFGVRQSFELPKVYQAKNALIEAETDLLKSERVLTEIELKKIVASLYWQTAINFQKWQVLSSYDTIYLDFLKLANLRVETGEASKIELLKIQNSYQKWDYQRGTALRDYTTFRQQFDYFVPNNQVDFKEVQIEQLRLNQLEISLKNHPLMQYYEQQKEVAAKQVTIEENVLSPTLTIGYASQIFNGNAGLNLVEIGVGVPLHRKPQQQRIEAAKMNASIIQAKAETDKFTIENERKQAIAELTKINQQIDVLDKRFSNNLGETLRLSKIAYEGSELPYFEYLNTIEEIIDIEQSKLDLVKANNEIVILINYGFGVE